MHPCQTQPPHRRRRSGASRSLCSGWTAAREACSDSAGPRKLTTTCYPTHRRGDEGEVVFEGSKELPLQRFPWLILDKTTDGFPFVHCSACIEHGKDGARNGCNGKGGRDLQIGSFGWHKASVQHDNAMKKQMGLMKKIEEQKRIDDFAKGDPEGTQISRLMRSIVFVCKTDTPIQMYPRLVQFLAEEEFADIPRQSDGVYITQ
ncbi:unnamed protein product [Closterium sp. NIES-54]